MKIRSITIAITIAVRRVIYRLGFRPRPGNILHSPSLALIHSMREVDLPQAFEQGMNRNKGNLQ